MCVLYTYIYIYIYTHLWSPIKPAAATQCGPQLVPRENAHLFYPKHNNMTRFVQIACVWCVEIRDAFNFTQILSCYCVCDRINVHSPYAHILFRIE